MKVMNSFEWLESECCQRVFGISKVFKWKLNGGNII